MNCKPIISGVPLIDIERSRYDKLLAREEELRILKKLILRADYTSDLTSVKEAFDIKPEIIEGTESEEK